MDTKQQKRYRRHRKIRTRVEGTAKTPRLCVFRSNKHTYAQLIDDLKREVILSSSDLEFKISGSKDTKKSKPRTGLKNKDLERKKEKGDAGRKVSLSYKVGELIAEKALKTGIKKIVFDRGGYKYHGRVKALAEGVRSAGIKL